MRLADSAEQATREITNFYRNFHSSRWLQDRFVIRMNHALSNEALEHINEAYADLCTSGEFEQLPCCSMELDEPELQRLPRLSFVFNGRNYGRLRELIDYLNETDSWAAALPTED